MNAMPFVIGALAFLALAYRLYYSFIATKVLMLNDTIEAPSFRLFDKHNYYPMPKWVVFGHHFAAIAGAGPLVGPVLAAQFGFMPGFVWMLVGAVVAGAVHDVVILTASVRHDGKSLAEIATIEISRFSGNITSVAVLIILIIALAGLGVVVVNALAESSWGTFTIAATIPIAIFMGLWMFKFRKGRTVEIVFRKLVYLRPEDFDHPSCRIWFLCLCFAGMAVTFTEGLFELHHETERNRDAGRWHYSGGPCNQNAQCHPFYPWWRTNHSGNTVPLPFHYNCLWSHFRIPCAGEFRYHP